MFRLNFRITANKTAGLKNAPAILAKNLRGGLETVGKRLRTSAQGKMRKDTGEEQKSLKISVTGDKVNWNLLVYSTLVQAFVDAYGLRRGVFPPFRVNSKLYKWVQRRFGNKPPKAVATVGTPHGPRVIKKKRKIKILKRLNRPHRQPTKSLSHKKRTGAKTNDVKRVAFLVARAIFTRGVPATNWPNKTLQSNKQMIVREMSNALQRAANEINRG